jgi:CYTH domain-containing protein
LAGDTVPKYAIVERERRFLVSRDMCPDLSPLPFRHVRDLYIEGSRLRLRAVEASDGQGAVYKLCKKYEPLSPISTPITNIYLTEEEYDLLSALGGRAITKRRYSLMHGVRLFSIDVFEGALSGLILAETEAGEAEAVDKPQWIQREVTSDPFFTGGELCRLTAHALASRLANQGGVP